jgi:hypothetical protein
LASDLGRALRGGVQGLRARGPKIGPNTQEAFEKLAEIAAQNDQLLNKAIGRAIRANKLGKEFDTEVDLGSGLTRRTDIVVQSDERGPIRLEVMWRRKTSRAEIANYVLGKLHNYGRALGFLE